MLILLLCGCRANSSPQNSPSENIGDSIKIAAYIVGPKITTTEILTFWIVNKSQECIVFPYNLGEKVFVKSNDGWLLVSDTIKYHYDNDITLTSSNGGDPSTLVTVAPDLSKITITSPTDFKVVLSGKLCSDKHVVVEKTIPFIVVPL